MKEIAILGVDLGGTNVRVGKVINNEIKRYFERGISAMSPADVVFREICEAIDTVYDSDIAGIGIGVPSVVDRDKGIVYSVENIPSWKEIPIKEKLEHQYTVPVYVNNDANCFALGEYYFGKGRNYSNIVGLIIGTGLGAGIITNGKLYCGKNCGAGEIGAIPYKDHTIEYYSSGQYFAREYGIDGEQLFTLVQTNEQLAKTVFARFGSELAFAVMVVMYAYDPEIIILGGSVSKAYPFFQKAMWERLQLFTYKHILDRLIIECSEHKDIAVLGAAALFYDAQKSNVITV